MKGYEVDDYFRVPSQRRRHVPLFPSTSTSLSISSFLFPSFFFSDRLLKITALQRLFVCGCEMGINEIHGVYSRRHLNEVK